MKDKFLLIIVVYILAVGILFYIVHCSCTSRYPLLKADYLVSCANCKCLFKVGREQISLVQQTRYLGCPQCPVCGFKK